MIVEVRRYTTQPGMRDSWIDYMTSTVIPFQESMGMTVIGQYTVEDDADAYVWMRSFEDLRQLEELSAAVYGSLFWTDTVVPVVRQHLVAGASTVTLLDPVMAEAPTPRVEGVWP